jgi:Protein of unknown function (DUF4232)
VSRRLRALALVASAGVVLAACSSTAPHSSTTTTTSHQTTTSPPSSTTTSSATSSTTTSTTAAATGCNRMTGAASPGQGAAGTITGFITVTNTDTSSCTTQGYPTVGLHGSAGTPLTVTIVDGLSVNVSPQANAAPSTVTIAPAGTAQFAYQYSDVPTGDETTCPTAATASVTVPGATVASPNFALAIAPCDNGTIRVSPLYQPT